MPRTYTCPFWSSERGKSLHCEGAAVSFKSMETRNAYVTQYCTHLPGWERCPIAAELSRGYESGKACPRRRKRDTIRPKTVAAAHAAGKDGPIS